MKTGASLSVATIPIYKRDEEGGWNGDGAGGCSPFAPLGFTVYFDFEFFLPLASGPDLLVPLRAVDVDHARFHHLDQCGKFAAEMRRPLC